MATKTNPGRFDCYAAACENEPIFTLRASDPLAPILVELWVRDASVLAPAPQGDGLSNARLTGGQRLWVALPTWCSGRVRHGGGRK